MLEHLLWVIKKKENWAIWNSSPVAIPMLARTLDSFLGIMVKETKYTKLIYIFIYVNLGYNSNCLLLLMKKIPEFSIKLSNLSIIST